MWFTHRRDPRIQDELRFHRDRLIEDYMAAGMSRTDAERRAFLEFGNVASTAERVQDVRGRWLEELVRDFRYAVRTLRRSPAFTLAAVATLALAIGANTAMFSVLNAVLFRPLPYRSPERLAMLWTEDPTLNLREGRSALWDVNQWGRYSQSFEEMATFDSVGTVLTGSEGAEQIPGASASPNLFSLLGVQPVIGRSFAASESNERLIMIGHAFWQSRFGGSREVLGSTLVINGVPSQIIGVLPADFEVGRLTADVWRTHATTPSVRGGQTWFVVGRLRHGVTFEQAQSEMSAVARRLSEQLPAAARGQGVTVIPLNLDVVGPRSRLALWMLGAAVFAVFLIAAANVTSLSLARCTARVREMAVRAALGANSARIVRQLLTESIVLAVISGLLGALLAFLGVRLVRALGPGNLPRLNEVSIDLRVLGWALFISLVAGVLVGLAPAMTTVRRDLRPSGEESGRSVSGGASSRRIRRALVVAEFALAIILLVGAGLLIRSWWHVNAIDPGFRPERVLVMGLASLGEPAQRADLYQRALEQIQAVPGVESAGIIDDLFSDNPREHVVSVERDEGMATERLRLTRDEVSPDFFRALATPLLRGRFFAATDRPDTPLVAIINDALAKRSWPDRDPVGRRFMFGPPESDGPWYTVVGVVTDMRRQGLERDPLPQVFVSLAQNVPSRNVNVFVRTSADDPLPIAGALRAAVGRVDRNAPIYGVALLEQQLGTFITQRRFQTSILVGFSAVALLMAAVGIYGLIQYSVATRTREIGLRMAIGAQRSDIFRLMIGEGLTLSLSGVALGLVGAWWLGGVGSSLLFGVTANDPMTFAAVSLLLTAVALVASYLPARRATKVDPIRALRTA